MYLCLHLHSSSYKTQINKPKKPKEYIIHVKNIGNRVHVHVFTHACLK